MPVQEMVLVLPAPRLFPLVEVSRVVDGDTFHAVVDLGFGVQFTITCRMARINAPELPTPEGVRSKDRLQEVVTRTGAGDFDARVYGQEKYGRWLVELTVRSNGTNINDLLVLGGFAVYV